MWARILAYAGYTLPFIVHTDVSNCELSAVLAREQDGIERITASVNKGLYLPEYSDAQGTNAHYSHYVSNYRV